MRAAAALLLTALCVPTSVPAQRSLGDHGLPRWADSALTAAGLGQAFDLASATSPELTTGDFDGDGLADLAVKVAAGLKRGIAVVHRIDGSVHLIGAGRPIGNGRDEVPTFGGWGATSTQAGHRFAPRRDFLYVVDPTAHPGLLAWTGTAYVWVDATD